MNLIIRQARRGDLQRIVDLAGGDDVDAMLGALNMDVYEAAFDDIEADRDSVLIVAERHAGLVASYQLTVLASLSDHGARRALVRDLRVAPDAAAEGVAGRMLEDARSRARSLGCRLLELVAEDDPDAESPEALGFTASGTRYMQRLD